MLAQPSPYLADPLPNAPTVLIAGPQLCREDAPKQTKVRPASEAPPTQSPQASVAPAPKKRSGSTKTPVQSTHGETSSEKSTSEDPASDKLHKGGVSDSGPTALELAYLDAKLKARASTERVMCCGIAALFVVSPAVIMTLYYYLFYHYTL